MLIAYKDALCACNDHDMNCGREATDDYQRAAAAWAASQSRDIDFNAKPDAELAEIAAEVAECSKRVFTPAPAPAGSTPPP